jgi:hypothetical protein
MPKKKENLAKKNFFLAENYKIGQGFFSMKPLIGPSTICLKAESPKRNFKFFTFFTNVGILRHCESF